MEITVRYPAPYLDTLAMVRALLPLKPQLAELANLQVARSEAVGLMDGEELLAVIGFYPLGDAVDEVFLLGASSDRVVPRLPALAKAARLTLSARLHSGTVAIVGFVKIGHEPGARLARLAGFKEVSDGAPTGMQRWELRHEWNYQRHLWRQLPKESAAGTAEATRADANFAGTPEPAGPR